VTVGGHAGECEVQNLAQAGRPQELNALDANVRRLYTCLLRLIIHDQLKLVYCSNCTTIVAKGCSKPHARKCLIQLGLICMMNKDCKLRRTKTRLSIYCCNGEFNQRVLPQRSSLSLPPSPSQLPSTRNSPTLPLNQICLDVAKVEK
jgi:hypothetical protein